MFNTVPVPVWIPQPSGARLLNSSILSRKPVTLTTDLSSAIEKLAKLDCPKKEPLISYSPDFEVEREKTLFPLKLPSKNSTQ
jgi:hypothetical protein